MATRHLSRILVIQSLYEWAFWNYPEGKLEKILKRNLEEFGRDIDEPEFPQKLAQGVKEHLQEIDELLRQHCLSWPFDRLPILEKNILRLATYELFWGDHQETPPKVAISEAVEICKNFSTQNSTKFVNGVLASLFRVLEARQEKK